MSHPSIAFGGSFASDRGIGGKFAFRSVDEQFGNKYSLASGALSKPTPTHPCEHATRQKSHALLDCKIQLVHINDIRRSGTVTVNLIVDGDAIPVPGIRRIVTI